MNRPAKRPRLHDRDEHIPNGPESPSQPASPPKETAVFEPVVRKLRSPFQLTWIRDLPEKLNQDAITLQDILGHPLITECWNFNYLHDVAFIMNAFDEDVRGSIKLHIVHGFWAHDDSRKHVLTNEAAHFPNVVLHAAPMPEMFGTHHSKMMVLLRRDDVAQIVIHTANSIPKDWTNMTNAVWRSPLLPLLSNPKSTPESRQNSTGHGERFKDDLLRYLRAYDTRGKLCTPLVEKLQNYDFSSIKATLIASVPGRHKPTPTSCWGWMALRRALGSVPCQRGESVMVIQISSIATLGPRDTWLRETLFKSLSTSREPNPASRPKFKVVFPTADEIRNCLDGYMAGASIHTKIQSPQQKRQLEYMKPFLCHWANDSPRGQDLGEVEIRDGGRNRAAPHIKTYIRYGQDSIDWALLTSANLSKQAWGDSTNASGEVRVASWEVGVLVWPALLADDSAMVGTFQEDIVTSEFPNNSAKTIISLRVPYSLPLRGYGKAEIPWVATMCHSELDTRGMSWEGH